MLAISVPDVLLRLCGVNTGGYYCLLGIISSDKLDRGGSWLSAY